MASLSNSYPHQGEGMSITFYRQRLLVSNISIDTDCANTKQVAS